MLSEIYQTVELFVLLLPHLWPNVAHAARHAFYALQSRSALEKVRA